MKIFCNNISVILYVEKLKMNEQLQQIICPEYGALLRIFDVIGVK